MTEVKMIYLTGRTGKKYRFYTFPGPEGLKAAGGVYAITKRSKKDKAWEHNVMKIDETHDMSRLKTIMHAPGYDFHKSANCLAARLENDPVRRRKTIEDLLGNYFPSMLTA